MTTVYCALQLAAPAGVGDTLLPAINTDGVVMISLALNVSVIVSPAFARVVSAALSDTMLTDVRVGGVRSMVTTLESVTAVTVWPEFPARSA